MNEPNLELMRELGLIPAGKVPTNPVERFIDYPDLIDGVHEYAQKIAAEYKQRAEAAEAKLRELEMPEVAYCAAGVEPCACAVANNIDAARYRALRNQDIESNFPRSGVFMGKVPDNQCLTGIDADNAVDSLFPAPKQ